MAETETFSEFAVPANHPCLVGHFPGHPVVPAVLLLEQVALALASKQRKISRIRNAKFVQPLLPDETATLVIAPNAGSSGFAIHRGSTVLALGQVETVPA